jgi:hypothetical protein
MSKKGFRKPCKRDSESIDNFAEGADVHTNVNTSKKQKKEQTQQPFYTTLQPQFKELIQAVAYYERISQREVVERAISAYYLSRPEKLNKAMEAYEQKS